MKSAWLWSCLFFVGLLPLSVLGEQKRLSMKPHELNALSAEEVDSLLKILPHDVDQFKLYYFMALRMSKSDPDSALRCINRVYELRDRTGFSNWDAYMARTKGIIQWQRGDVQATMKYYLKGLEIAERNKDSVEIASILRKIGTIQWHHLEYEEAKKYYQRSLLYDDPPVMGTLLIQAIDGLERKDHKQVMQLCRVARRKILAGNTRNKRFLPTVTLYIGLMHYEMGQADSAKPYFREAMKLGEQMGLPSPRVGAATGLAIIEREQGRPNEALALGQLVQPEINKIGAFKVVGMYYEVMVQIYEDLGQFQMSSLYKDSIILVKTQLYDEQRARIIAETSLKYLSTKKDKEIAELKVQEEQAKTELARTKYLAIIAGILFVSAALVVILLVLRQRSRQKQLAAEFGLRRAELEQKALRAQMNPHFIFNSLNAVQRLYLSKDMERANDYLSDFGQLMRRILDNSGKEYITLHEELETLELYLKLEQGRMPELLEYEMVVDEEVDKHHLLVPPLILQPIVENAIWHGIAPMGKGKVQIKVEASEEQDLLICTVQDNGIGIDHHQRKYRDKTPSPNGGAKPHHSWGLKITQERLGDQYKIEAKQISSTGGTRVTLKIPFEV